MKRFVFLATVFASTCLAQKRNSPTQYAKMITAADLKHHLMIIAGTEMQGRRVSTVGEKRATAYIAQYFASLGLVSKSGDERGDGYVMPFPIYKESYTGKLEVNGISLLSGKDFVADISNYSCAIKFKTAIWLGSTVPDSSIRIDMKGKLVIVSSYNASAYAAEHGAAAVFIGSVEETLQPMPAFSESNQENYFNSIGPVIFHLSKSSMAKIWNSRDGSSVITPEYSVLKLNIVLGFDRNESTIYSSNIVGIIEGTDKRDEYLLLTAHHDHLGMRGDSTIYYGADDNGSGTVAVMTIAHAFAKAKSEGCGPRRSVVFMTVSGEEKGLWGSDYYSENPLFSLEKTTAALNMDMIGRIDPAYGGDSLSYLYVIGDDRLSSDLRPISDAINKKYGHLTLDRKFNDPNDRNQFYFRSDHYNFARKGVPAIFYFNGIHNDYHMPSDTADKINYLLLEKRTRFIFNTAWEIANRDNMLKRDLAPVN